MKTRDMIGSETHVSGLDGLYKPDLIGQSEGIHGRARRTADFVPVKLEFSSQRSKEEDLTFTVEGQVFKRIVKCLL